LGADLCVSSKTSEGLDALRAAIVGQDVNVAGDLSLTSERQRDLAALAEARLREAAQLLEAGVSLDRAVAAVNEAKLRIEEVTGRVTSEDVLASIFSKFCIGK
jgi:tRNA modification GTPase